MEIQGSESTYLGRELEHQYLAQLGARLKKQRQGKHLTQAQLAERLGVTRTTITNIENGFQRTSVFLLVRIAEELQEPVPSLILSLAEVREQLQQRSKQIHEQGNAKLVTKAITDYGMAPITQPRDSVEQVLESHDVPSSTKKSSTQSHSSSKLARATKRR